MKDYVTNTIVLKNGDHIEIIERSTLSPTQTLMYKISHGCDKIVVHNGGGTIVIPSENIMFATSCPLEIVSEDMNDEI